MVTPLMIEIAIHYYATSSAAGDYGAREGRSTAPAVVEQSLALMEHGILRKSFAADRSYEATEAARVWIEALCATPFPIQRWVMPEMDAA